MSPAASFIWIVGVVSAAWLCVTTVAPVSIIILTKIGRRVRPLSTPIAMIMASIMFAAIVRPSPGFAAVPPPAERTIVSAETASGALSIRNPITQRATVGAGRHVHEVVKGESLWRIARTILERLDGETTGAEISTLWRAIYAANSDVIGGDPNLIHPGQVLTIPGGVHG